MCKQQLLLLTACGILACAMTATGETMERNPTIATMHSDDTPSPPKWADAYSVEFDVSMPHFFVTQPQGLNIPVKAWWDGPNRRSKIESFGGTDTVMFMRNEKKKVEYEIHPRIDQLKCWKNEELVNPNPEQLQGLLGEGTPILPDLSSWLYAGSLVLDGKHAYVWQLHFREMEAVNTYNFYTSVDGAPLKYHMMGYNTIAIGHYDEYIYDFKSYSPGQDDAAFQVPDLCQPQLVATLPKGTHGWLARQMPALLPSANAPAADAAVDVVYAHWSLLHQRGAARSPVELQQRLERFRQAHAKVAAHNAQSDKTFTMQLGRFADWSDEEYYGKLMPDVWRRKQGLPNLRQARMEQTLKTEPDAFRPLAKFVPKLKPSQLPKEVDWRGTGADPGVKDQGMCGSCWTFGATATMEGAWYVSTGEKRSFSEQQILDCAYDWGNNGCDGGDAKPAINYVAHSGGIALEQDYFYHSTGDFCRADNYTRIGKFDGFLQVKPRDELAMMEAVYTMGPLAVAVDPGPDSFAYYKEGVWTDKACTIKNLDHQVILFGYGTTPEGVDYWLMKNMWSKFWGMDGYMKIARGKADCGISSDGIVAVVSKDAMRPGRGSRALEAVRRW